MIKKTFSNQPCKETVNVEWCISKVPQYIKGSQQQGTLVQFSLFREKLEKHNFWQFSKYVDFSCKNEQGMFENSEFRRFCNNFTA